MRAVAPLVDMPQVPVGWIDAARWQQLMGDDYDAQHPGFTMQFSPRLSVTRATAILAVMKRLRLTRVPSGAPAAGLHSQRAADRSRHQPRHVLPRHSQCPRPGGRPAQVGADPQRAGDLDVDERSAAEPRHRPLRGVGARRSAALSMANGSDEAWEQAYTDVHERFSVGRSAHGAVRGAVLHGRGGHGAHLDQLRPRGPAAGAQRLLHPGHEGQLSSSSRPTPSRWAR